MSLFEEVPLGNAFVQSTNPLCDDDGIPKTLKRNMASANELVHLPWLPTKPWNCLPTVVFAWDRLMSDWKR